MREIPGVLLQDLRPLSISPRWIVLIDIAVGGGSDTHLRYARDFSDIEFGGETYSAFNFDISVLRSTKSGEMCSENIRLTGVTQELLPYLDDLNDNTDSELTITLLDTDQGRGSQ